MRTSLVPGMLAMLSHNLNRGIADLRLFEAGAVFCAEGAHAAQANQIVLARRGAPPSPAYNYLRVQSRSTTSRAM